MEPRHIAVISARPQMWDNCTHSFKRMLACPYEFHGNHVDPGAQMSVLGPAKLELQMILSCLVSAGNQLEFSARTGTTTLPSRLCRLRRKSLRQELVCGSGVLQNWFPAS